MKQRKHLIQTIRRRVGRRNSKKQLAALRRFANLLNTDNRPTPANAQTNESEEFALLNGVHLRYSDFFPSAFDSFFLPSVFFASSAFFASASAPRSTAAALPPSDAISAPASTSASVVTTASSPDSGASSVVSSLMIAINLSASSGAMPGRRRKSSRSRSMMSSSVL